MRIPSSSLMPSMGFTLPVVGEDHPLRKGFQRTFLRSATIAMLIHVVVAGSWLAVSRSLGARTLPTDRPSLIFRVEPIPPPIHATEPRAASSLVTQVAQQPLTIPEPVPDFDAEELTLIFTANPGVAPTNDLPSLTDGGDLPVASAGDAIPLPNEYVAVEEMPQLINAAEVQRATIDLYPEVAKSAGVEGTVDLRVYIGKTGDVENVIVVDGPPMLRDAATQAVKQAKFKPALQQHHPVGIWVVWPVVFSLRS